MPATSEAESAPVAAPPEGASIEAPRPSEAAPAIDEPNLLPAVHDGIRMYDHAPPSWGPLIMAVMVVFAGAYGLYFHVLHAGATPEARYRAELARYEARRSAAEAAEAAEISEYMLADETDRPEVVARGRQVFASHCASCHGADGAGLSGPNLTDDFQIHGSTRVDIYDTIRSGVPWTAMPPWGGQLRASDLVAVTAYAITLRGTNLPGRSPQGSRVGSFLPAPHHDRREAAASSN